MTDYLAIALLHHSEGVAVNESLEVTPSRHLDLGQLHLAARINISEWRNNKQSKQYISFIKGKGGKKVSDYFRDFIGCQEGVDSPSETRTLLKAFSDFVESEGMAEQQAREKTETLVDYATSQARIGEPMTLDALSELMDDQQPRAFYDYIRNKDYGLSPEIPADKRTLNQFRRFTGRAEGPDVARGQRGRHPDLLLRRSAGRRPPRLHRAHARRFHLPARHVPDGLQHLAHRQCRQAGRIRSRRTDRLRSRA